MRTRAALVIGILAFVLQPQIAEGQHPGVNENNLLDGVPLEAIISGDAIVLLRSQYFKVSGIGKAVLQTKEVVTVLNDEGRSAATQVIDYDDLRKLKSVSGRVLDANGKVVRKLGKEDVADISATDGQTLYDGHRIRLVHLEHDVFPYTVEIEWQIEFDGLINWPSWRPQATDVFLKHSRFEIDVPNGIEFRVYADKLVDDRTVLNKGNRTSHVWVRQNIAPLELEEWGPPASYQMPTLLVAPVHFSIEGTYGSMDSWANFGEWYYMLSADKQTIPFLERKKIEKMVSGLDTREATRLLYDYMQSKTRYVSVQLGLGGWQPFDAIYVEEKGYGDCKALTNYMYALLQIADIEAYPALIKSGDDGGRMYEDFPCNQFNHVVLYVPTGNEPIWLECTSQTIPFGELSSSTEDRPALVVRPGASELIRTPASRSDDNVRERLSSVTLTRTGSAAVETEFRFRGNMQDRIRERLTRSSDLDRVEYIREEIDLPSFDIEELDFSRMVERSPEVGIDIKLSVPKYASVSGKRIFLKPNMFTRWEATPPEMEERTQPVDFRFAYTAIDTTVFQLPTGYSVEAEFKTVSLRESFADFDASVHFDDSGKAVYRRKLVIHSRTVPAADYDKLRNFLLAVRKSDRSQLVLVKK